MLLLSCMNAHVHVDNDNQTAKNRTELIGRYIHEQSECMAIVTYTWVICLAPTSVEVLKKIMWRYIYLWAQTLDVHNPSMSIFDVLLIKMFILLRVRNPGVPHQVRDTLWSIRLFPVMHGKYWFEYSSIYFVEEK